MASSRSADIVWYSRTSVVAKVVVYALLYLLPFVVFRNDKVRGAASVLVPLVIGACGVKPSGGAADGDQCAR